jgi:TPR repeat protein
MGAGVRRERADLLYMMGKQSAAAGFELGRSGPADFVRAVALYRQAAVLGYPLAQSGLGRLYEQGHGVARDDVLAYVWYALAADSGDTIATANRDAAAARLGAADLLRAEALARELRRHLP